MDLTIRDIEPSDAEAVVAILNPIIAARRYTVFSEPFSVDLERNYIVNFPARGIWKVAMQPAAGRLVGFQVLEPFASYTKAFDHVATMGTYVDLAQRRQGVATALFEATLEAARQKGYEKIFTFVRADIRRRWRPTVRTDSKSWGWHNATRRSTVSISTRF